MDGRDAPRRKIVLPPADYQPSKAEMEKAYDMPGAAAETIRAAVFNPVDIVKKRPAG